MPPSGHGIRPSDVPFSSEGYWKGFAHERSGSSSTKPEPKLGLFCQQSMVELPLPDTASVGGHHRLPDLAAEGLPKLIEVLNGAVGPPLPGGVRIRLRPQPR